MIYPTPEESKVYAYWLRHLSKGPKWDGLPFERREEIAIRLCEEVQAVAAATYLGLAYDYRNTGYGELEQFMAAAVAAIENPKDESSPHGKADSRLLA